MCFKLYINTTHHISDLADRMYETTEKIKTSLRVDVESKAI